MIETGISFGSVHSFQDLDLILASVEIPPASPKETYVDIPGADGSIDMTEALGEVKFADRTGAKFTFYMNPAGDLSESAWEAKKMEVSNRLNGLKCNITLDKDPGYYWQGRCKLDSFASDKRKRKIVVGARLAPRKMKNSITKVSFALTETPRSVTLRNAGATVCPSITCTGEATVVFSGGSITLAAGTHKVLEIQLYQGANSLTVSGTGTITFSYQESVG